MSKEIKDQVVDFSTKCHQIVGVYEEYSRQNGLSYTTMEILFYITRIEDCTQKKICEMSLLPKQTVNHIITSLVQKGYLELRELPSDRRAKTIHLTQMGKQYSDSMTKKINEAQYQAMAAIPEDLRKELLKGLDLYQEEFRKNLVDDK